MTWLELLLITRDQHDGDHWEFLTKLATALDATDFPPPIEPTEDTEDADSRTS